MAEIAATGELSSDEDGEDQDYCSLKPGSKSGLGEGGKPSDGQLKKWASRYFGVATTDCEEVSSLAEAHAWALDRTARLFKIDQSSKWWEGKCRMVLADYNSNCVNTGRPEIQVHWPLPKLPAKASGGSGKTQSGGSKAAGAGTSSAAGSKGAASSSAAGGAGPKLPARPSSAAASSSVGEGGAAGAAAELSRTACSVYTTIAMAPPGAGNPLAQMAALMQRGEVVTPMDEEPDVGGPGKPKVGQLLSDVMAFHTDPRARAIAASGGNALEAAVLHAAAKNGVDVSSAWWDRRKYSLATTLNITLAHTARTMGMGDAVEYSEEEQVLLSLVPGSMHGEGPGGKPTDDEIKSLAARFFNMKVKEAREASAAPMAHAWALDRTARVYGIDPGSKWWEGKCRMVVDFYNSNPMAASQPQLRIKWPLPKLPAAARESSSAGGSKAQGAAAKATKATKAAGAGTSSGAGSKGAGTSTGTAGPKLPARPPSAAAAAAGAGTSGSKGSSTAAATTSAGARAATGATLSPAAARAYQEIVRMGRDPASPLEVMIAMMAQQGRLDLTEQGPPGRPTYQQMLFELLTFHRDPRARHIVESGGDPMANALQKVVAKYGVDTRSEWWADRSKTVVAQMDEFLSSMGPTTPGAQKEVLIVSRQGLGPDGKPTDQQLSMWAARFAMEAEDREADFRSPGECHAWALHQTAQVFGIDAQSAWWQGKCRMVVESYNTMMKEQGHWDCVVQWPLPKLTAAQLSIQPSASSNGIVTALGATTTTTTSGAKAASTSSGAGSKGAGSKGASTSSASPAAGGAGGSSSGKAPPPSLSAEAAKVYNQMVQMAPGYQHPLEQMAEQLAEEEYRHPEVDDEPGVGSPGKPLYRRLMFEFVSFYKDPRARAIVAAGGSAGEAALQQAATKHGVDTSSEWWRRRRALLVGQMDELLCSMGMVIGMSDSQAGSRQGQGPGGKPTDQQIGMWAGQFGMEGTDNPALRGDAEIHAWALHKTAQVFGVDEGSRWWQDRCRVYIDAFNATMLSTGQPEAVVQWPLPKLTAAQKASMPTAGGSGSGGSTISDAERARLERLHREAQDADKAHMASLGLPFLPDILDQFEAGGGKLPEEGEGERGPGYKGPRPSDKQLLRALDALTEGGAQLLHQSPGELLAKLADRFEIDKASRWWCHKGPKIMNLMCANVAKSWGPAGPPLHLLQAMGMAPPGAGSGGGSTSSTASAAPPAAGGVPKTAVRAAEATTAVLSALGVPQQLSDLMGSLYLHGNGEEGEEEEVAGTADRPGISSGLGPRPRPKGGKREKRAKKDNAAAATAATAGDGAGADAGASSAAASGPGSKSTGGAGTAAGGAAGAAAGARGPDSCWCCGASASANGVKLKKCARCLVARYCSTACSHQDWAAGHRAVCRGLAAERQAG